MYPGRVKRSLRSRESRPTRRPAYSDRASSPAIDDGMRRGRMKRCQPLRTCDSIIFPQFPALSRPTLREDLEGHPPNSTVVAATFGRECMDLVERLPVLADVDSGLAETLAVLTERDALISRRRALRTMGTAAL